MKTVSNSYHQAILDATFESKFPEYNDHWRCYHPTSRLSDSDYRDTIEISHEAIEGFMS